MIDHVSLGVADLERSARFYEAVLGAVGFAKLEVRQQNGNPDHPFSMASLKRRAFNQHLIDRICEHLANGQSLEKSSPDYETLCNYL